MFLLSCLSAYADMQDSLLPNLDSLSNKRLPMRTQSSSSSSSLLPSIPTSPQAESFQRVGDYSVNNASGIPDISIPLFEIDHHGYKIPLTLRYIATPLRPSYNYDVCGHGWGLSTGFCITRTVETMRDEANYFKLHENVLNGFYSTYEDGLKDYNLRYDQFHATLPNGASFSFYIRRNQSGQLEYVISDRKQWKISCSLDGIQLTGFTVTDNAGVKYFFFKADEAIGVQDTYNVAWYLTRIELPNTPNPILFEYQQTIRQTTVMGTAEPIITIERFWSYPFYEYEENRDYSISSRIDFPNTNTNYKMPLLSTISYGPTTIRFSYQNSANESTFNYLDKITVSEHLTAIKEFYFSYQKQQFHSYPLASLTRLVEQGTNVNTDSLVYQFIYSGTSSMQNTDHWGYCCFGNPGTQFPNVANFNVFLETNDQNPNAAEMPHVTYVSDNPLLGLCYKKVKLASSSFNYDPRQGSNASSHDYLTTIIYPTGGWTEFIFEPHRFVTATDNNGDYVPTKKNRKIIQGGGFRIQKISNYTVDGKLGDVRTFCYGPTYRDANNRHLNLPDIEGSTSLNHIGFGEPVVDPNFITYTNFKYSIGTPMPIDQMLLGKYLTHGSAIISPFRANALYDTWHWECSFSPLYFRSLLKGRNAVVYPEITEYYGDVSNLDSSPLPITGKTVYKYDIYNEMEDSVYTERVVYYGHVLDVEEDQGRRDLLTEKSVYRYDGAFYLQQKEDYTYSIYEKEYVWDYIFGNIYTHGDYAPECTVRNVMYDKLNILTNRILLQKVDTFFTETGPYVQSETYAYNDKDIMEGKTIIGNWPKSESYTYPSASATAPLIERKLADRNMMTTLLEQKTSVYPSSLYDVSGYKLDYDAYGVGTDTLLLPSRLYRLNVGNAGSSFEEDQQVLSYTSNGNPLEVVDHSGMHSVYLWSYDDRYLIAEIKNATLAQVSSAINSVFGLSIESLTNSSTPNATFLSSLHSYVGLSNAMVSTWTYLPLRGVTSYIDPSGMATYYDYDGLGRLKEVYRYEGNVVSPSNKRTLNLYDYHTKAQ